VLPSGQKLTFGLQATITLEVVPFHTYERSQRFCHILHASWKSSFVRVYSDSASTTIIVSKWRLLSFIFNRGRREKPQEAKSGKQGGWGMAVMFLVKTIP
jgi:hypothetical protein